MIQHLPAVLIIVGASLPSRLLCVVFVADVVLAINFVLELLHRLLNRMTGVRDDLRVSLLWPPGFPRTKYRLSPASIRRIETQP